MPFPLNANELLRAQPKDGICTAHFFPPAEDVRTASCYYGNTWVWGRNGCRTTNCGATLYVRAGVSVGRLWVFFAGVSVSRLCVCALLGWMLWLSGGGGVLSNWWCSLVGRRCSKTWGSVHPTTEQECLAFGLYIVAVRLSCTSEARATQWRIFVQVAELVWVEIPGARAGIFGLWRHNMGEIQTARLQTHFLTLQITKHWLSCRNLRLRGGEALRICKYTYKSNEKVSFA